MDKLAPGGNYTKLNIMGLVIYAITFALFCIFCPFGALDIVLLVGGGLFAVQNFIYVFIKNDMKAKIVRMRILVVYIWGLGVLGLTAFNTIWTIL